MARRDFTGFIVSMDCQNFGPGHPLTKLFESTQRLNWAFSFLPHYNAGSDVLPSRKFIDPSLIDIKYLTVI